MAISFSAGAKAEICRNFPQKKCCVLAQCFGILLFCNSFSADGIRIVTESRELAQCLPRLFRKAFSLSFDQLPRQDGAGKLVFQLTQKEKLAAILESYGFEPTGTVALQVNLPIVEEDCCKAAFLRGAFLAGGSVTDPAKGYHMEIADTHTAVARQTYALMEEALGFYPKQAERGGAQVLYLKQNERIADFLTYLGAPVAAMGMMEARLEKDLKNRVNRRCNCDDANTSKQVEAAQEQLAAIRALRESGRLDGVPEKLRQAALTREEHPEASLTELAGMMTPPISKPAMNHRLKRLTEMAKEDGV